MKSAPRDLLSDVNHSIEDTDWSVTDATKDYVSKVKEMNRSLINVEAIALKKHIEIEMGTRYALSQAGKNC